MEEILINIGLTKEEVEIYLSLLDKGPQTANQLGKSTKVKRTYVYKVCQTLANKGLVKIEKQGRTTYFAPLSPDHLLTIANEKKQSLETAKMGLESILDSLKGQYRIQDTRPVVQYFEGVEGVKKVYMDTIKDKNSIIALVETTKINKEIYDWVTTDYAKQRVDAEISVRAIVASGAKTQTYTGLNQKELRETKIISSSKFPFENEIDVYGSKVAIINHTQGQSLIGIIIDNESIAKTFRSWFELTWGNL